MRKQTFSLMSAVDSIIFFCLVLLSFLLSIHLSLGVNRPLPVLMVGSCTLSRAQCHHHVSSNTWTLCCFWICHSPYVDLEDVAHHSFPVFEIAQFSLTSAKNQVNEIYLHTR